jgi:hypothetical protein
VEEKAGTFTVAIEKSSFPNFDGVNGRQRGSARQILLEMPNTTYAWYNF